MRIGSLCSGYGGLDMAAEAVFGGSLAWVSDIDKGACKILAHRYPDVPNLGDFTATDWSSIETVDVLCAGFPCQPVSLAGKRLGDHDERWLWDDVLRAVCDLRPGHVLLENVRGLLTARNGELFGRVLGALADVGYDARWHGIKAADVGAPHNRFRVFIGATDAHRVGRARVGRLDPGRRDADRCDRPDGSRAAAQSAPLLPSPRTSDTNGPGRHGSGGLDLRTAVAMLPTPSRRDYKDHTIRREPHRPDSVDTLSRALTDWGKYAAAVHRWEALTRPAPAPIETGPKGSPRLSPAFSEWMMGLPAGWVTDVPGITRSEALKAIGNGVCPQQATAALREMLAWEAAA